MSKDDSSVPDLRSPSISRRVTGILYSLTEREGGLSVRAVAEEAGSSRSATHRILQMLADEGYAEIREQGRYTVGPKLIELAARVFGVVPLIRVADAIMVRLVQEVGETCYLAVYSASDTVATFVHRVESDEPVRHIQPLGSRLPLHVGAVGKAILAASPSIDLDDLDITRDAPRVPVNRKDLKRDVSKARELGYAVSVQERLSGVAAVASALRSGEDVIGALSVAIPVSRVPANGLDSIGETVKSYSLELSAAMQAMGAKRF